MFDIIIKGGTLPDGTTADIGIAGEPGSDTDSETDPDVSVDEEDSQDEVVNTQESDCSPQQSPDKKRMCVETC